VEAPVIPDYLMGLVKLFDKDGDGLVNQSEVEAAKQFVSSQGLRELVALFDADGDGNIDVGDISAARKLVMSMKTSEQKMFEAEGLDKLGAIKRGEKLARLKAEEKREETMRKQHDGIQAKLKEKKMKRRAAIHKMELSHLLSSHFVSRNFRRHDFLAFCSDIQRRRHVRAHGQVQVVIDVLDRHVVRHLASRRVHVFQANVARVREHERRQEQEADLELLVLSRNRVAVHLVLVLQVPLQLFPLAPTSL